MFRIQSTLYRAEIDPDLKKPYQRVITQYSDKILKTIEELTKYRKTKQLQQDIHQENRVSITAVEIQQKILLHASPSTDVPVKNLKTVLTNMILQLQEQLTPETIITKIYSTPRDAPTDTGMKVYSIHDFYEIVAQLRTIIVNLLNTKRDSFGRKTPGKYSQSEFTQVKSKLLTVVEDATETMGKIIVNPVITDIQKQDETETTEYKLNDNVGNLLIAIRDSTNRYSPGSMLLVQDLFSQIPDTLSTTNPIAKHVLLARYTNALNDLESSTVQYLAEKQKLVSLINKIRATGYADDKTLPLLPQPTETIAPTPNRVRELGTTLDNVLDTLVNKPLEIVPEDQPADITAFINKLPTTTKYQKILKDILIGMRKGWKDKLPLAFYERMVKKEYKRIVLVYFTGFFQQYSTVYGVYPKKLVDVRATEFGIWVNNHIDTGKFLNEHVALISKMIDDGHLVFNKTLQMLVAVPNTSPDTYKVEQVYQELIQLKTKLNSQVTNEPLPTGETGGECKHVEIQRKLDELYTDLQEQGVNQEILSAQISKYESEKAEIIVVTNDALVCKLCGVRVESVFSYTPETFERGEELRREQAQVNIRDMLKEKQREENKAFVDKYIPITVKLLGVNIVENVSIDDAQDNVVSKTDIVHLKQSIPRALEIYDKSIYQFAQEQRKQLKSNRQGISASALKSQSVH
jgi:hypothetical protein